MTDSDGTCRFLVSLKLPDPEEPDRGLLALLEGSEVHLLGSYIVSDQTAPEQARDEFEEDARQTLRDYEETFASTGQVVDTHLVFTPDISETLERLEDEIAYDALLVPGPVDEINRIAVGLAGDVDFDKVANCCHAIFEGESLEVLLLHVTDDVDEVDENELMMRGIRDKLEELGVDTDAIEVEAVQASNPAAAIAKSVEHYDIAVVAEQDASTRPKLFTEAWELVTDRYDGPVFIVTE